MGAMEPSSPLNPAFRQAFDRLLVPATVRDLKRQGYEEVRLIHEDDLLAWAAEVLSRRGKDQLEQAQPERAGRSPGVERADDGRELDAARQQCMDLLEDRARLERERQAFKEHIAKVRAESELRLQELRRLSGLLEDVESGGIDIPSSLAAAIEKERGKFDNLLSDFHSSARR